MHLPGILILLHYFLSIILGRDLVALISAGSFTAKAAKIRQWPRDSQWISAVELCFCCFCTSHSHGKRLPNMPCPHISQLHSNKHKKKSSRGRTKKVLISWWWMQHGLSRYLKPSHDISCDTSSKEHNHDISCDTSSKEHKLTNHEKIICPQLSQHPIQSLAFPLHMLFQWRRHINITMHNDIPLRPDYI